MKRTNWLMTSCLAILSLALPAFAQVEDAARQVLTESQAAVNKVESLEYKVKTFATGPLKDIIDLSGDVTLIRAKGAAAPTYLIAGRMKDPGKKDKTLNLVSDGQNVQWLDANNNKLVRAQQNDAHAQEEFSTAKQYLITEMANGQQYENILRMAKVEKRGVDKVNGEMCDLIVGTSTDGSRVFTYAISAADRLPRRLEMATGNDPANKIALVTEILDLKATEKKIADLKLVMPPGYVVEDLGGQVPTPAANVPAVANGPAIGAPAPDFKSSDTSGAEVSNGALKGKATVLQFFGTMFKASNIGCAQTQMLADEVKGKNVEIIGIACREPSAESAAKYWNTNKLTYRLITKGDEIASQFSVKGFPSYVVLDPKGQVTAFFQDNPGKDKLMEAAMAAVDAK